MPLEKLKVRLNIQSVRTKQVTLGSYTGCLDRITCDIEWGGTFSLDWVGFITILVNIKCEQIGATLPIFFERSLSVTKSFNILTL